MNRLQRVPRKYHTGTIDYLNIAVCLLMVAYNSIDLIVKGSNLTDKGIYLLPYIIYPILNIFLRSNKITAGLYLLVGILTISLDINTNGASGLLYIYFSYNELKSSKFGIILISLSYIALSIRFLILNAIGSEAIVSILLFTFIFATFYFKVIKDNSKISKLPEEIKAILKLYCNGYTYEQISLTLGLGITPGTVRRKITAFMNKYDIKNDAQLGKWLHRNV